MIFELFVQRMSETAWKKERNKKKKKSSEETASSSARRQANFKYEMSPERGHHFKQESVWRKEEAAAWLGGRAAVPHASSFPPLLSGLSVSRRTPEKRQRQREKTVRRPTLLSPGTGLWLPWTLWMKVFTAQWCGSTVPSHSALKRFFYPPLHPHFSFGLFKYIIYAICFLYIPPS